MRDDGDVFAFLLNLRLADRDDEVRIQRLVGNVHRETVHQLVLQMANRIVVADGSFEKTPGKERGRKREGKGGGEEEEEEEGREREVGGEENRKEERKEGERKKEREEELRG